MKSRFILPVTALSLLLGSVAAAQVPPEPAPPETDLQKDARQLFSDLTAHHSKIERAEVDDETIRLQDDILATWDRMLDQAKEPPPPKPSPQNQNQSPQQNQEPTPNSQQQPGDSSSQPEEGQENKGQAGQQPGEQEGQQDPEGTAEGPGQSTGQSTDQPADQADAEARMREQSRFAQLRQEERERLMKEVWGKLPLRIRQKLLNASDEKYLPEYEDRIEEYFRKLSTPEGQPRGE